MGLAVHRGLVGSLIIAVTALTALSGCLGGSSAFEARCPTAAPTFEPGNGAIEGTVFDDDQVPVECAEVGSIELGSHRTDAAGYFSIPDVAPGEHRVFASALGHTILEKTVTVKPDQVTRVTFPLGVDESLITEPYLVGPYEEVFTIPVGYAYKLTPDCIYRPLTEVNPLIKTCGAARFPYPTDNNYDGTEYGIGAPGSRGVDAEGQVDRDWRTAVIETNFEPSLGNPSRSILLDVLFPNVTRDTSNVGAGAADQDDPRYFAAEETHPPITFRIDRSQLVERDVAASEQHGNVHGRAFPYWNALGTAGSGPDATIMLDQSYSLWITVAYHDPLAEDFTALRS